MHTKMGLLGKKLGMTQIFDEAGNAVGVTVIELGPNTVLQVKTGASKDGYAAVQLGFGTRKESRCSKAQIGHAAKVGVPAPRYVREVRVTDQIAGGYTAGQVVSLVGLFTVKDKVDVTGTSKGCGFAGVMKRYNFSGFKRTHGAHEYKRHGGSIGTRLTPGMTFKGVKMPGHMGDSKTTVQNLRVVKLDTDRNLLFLRGAVPGKANGLVMVRQAVKGPK